MATLYTSDFLVRIYCVREVLTDLWGQSDDQLEASLTSQGKRSTDYISKQLYGNDYDD